VQVQREQLQQFLVRHLRRPGAGGHTALGNATRLDLIVDDRGLKAAEVP
jgi:hypothetical protein